MPSVNALPVEVPFPRYKFSARFAGTPGQHRIAKICKNLEDFYIYGDYGAKRMLQEDGVSPKSASTL